MFSIVYIFVYQTESMVQIHAISSEKLASSVPDIISGSDFLHQTIGTGNGFTTA